MIKKQAKEIQQYLATHGKNSSKEFSRTMIPGVEMIYGVKTPELNELVKKYKDGSFDLAELLWKGGSYEEKIIAIKIMEKKGKSDPGRLLTLFRKFSTSIDNWAVCDGMGMQFLRGIVKLTGMKYSKSPQSSTNHPVCGSGASRS